MIATIINYCTNDYRFLKGCLDEVRLFSDQIIVVVCDHFFDGSEENRALLNRSYSEHPDVTFVEFAFDEERPYGLSPFVSKNHENWIHYWHSTSRYVGYFFLQEDVETVLFLDVDEICDGKRFREWLDLFPYMNYSALWLSEYFYFREPSNRAKIAFRSGLLVAKAAVTPELLLDEYERRGLFISVKGEKLDLVNGLDGKPLIHHYSWVRTKEELEKKVCWGHHLELDWKALIEDEFKTPFTGEDKIWGLEYEMVAPFFDPLSISVPKLKKGEKAHYPNVSSVNRDTITKLSIDLI